MANWVPYDFVGTKHALVFFVAAVVQYQILFTGGVMRTIQLRFVTISVMAALAFTGCVGIELVHGSGDVVTQARVVERFDAIAFEGEGDIYLTEDTLQSITIETDDNILPLFETYVRGTTLVLKPQDYTTLLPSRLTARISAPLIQSIVVSGSGTIIAQNTLTAKDFSVTVNGSGSVSLPVQNESMTIRINGSGDVTVDGFTTENRVVIAGSGACKARLLQTRKTGITITGSGGCRVNAAELLSVEISGSGDVYYTGKPEIVERITGTGSVRAEN
jgi:hypothetical protein